MRAKAVESRFRELNQALRQINRAVARETDPNFLLSETVSVLTSTNLFTSASVVQWDGLKTLSAAQSGPDAIVIPSLTPSCLRGRGSCSGCSLLKVRVEGSMVVVPLRSLGSCLGALLLERPSCPELEALSQSEAALLSDLGETLHHGLRSLEQRAALHRSQEMLRDIGRMGKIGGWDFDAGTGEGAWTDELAYIHDTDPKVPIDSQRGIDFYHPTSRPRIEAAIEGIVQRGESFDLELEIVSAKGVRKWVRTIGAPVLKDGRVVRVQGIMQDISARKESQEELRESEDRARTLFEHAGIGMAETDPITGRFLKVNRKLCEILGYTADQLVRKRWPEVTHPDDMPGDFQRLIDLRGGFSFLDSWDKRYLRADGTYIWVRVTVSRVESPTGETRSLITTVEDVSERHRDLQTIREHELRLATIFDVTQAGILITSLADSRIIEVNRGMEELLGWSQSELLGRPLGDFHLFVDPQAATRLRALFDANGGLPSTECKVRRKSGEEAYFLFTARPGEIDGEACAIGVWHDVTELRRNDAARKESADQLRATFDIAPVGMAETDPDTGRFVSVNGRMCSITGYSSKELLEMSFSDLTHPEDREQNAELFARVMSGELAEYHAEKRYVRKDGRFALVNVNSTVLRDSSGTPTRTIGIVEDITAQRAVEEQLLASQRMEAVGRLAGGVAHDFNNLLTVILSYSELAVAELALDDPMRADLREVVEAGHRAASLTRQLLAFGRKQILTLEVLDLNDLVESVEKMLSRVIGEDVALQVDPGEALYTVRADRGQLEQVLLNLAVNSRDAMPVGGRIVLSTGNVRMSETLAATLELSPGDYARITVSDSGSGMDDATLGRIFEPFFTTKEPGKGTGLGLSMVYGIVRQSDGGIAVESRPGEGTEVSIYLRRSEERASSLEPIAQHDAGGSGSETILVTEDEPALLSLARRILSKAGYTVLSAANGGEAFLLCEKHGAEINMVLSDVVMPGMSGPELLERVRPLCPKARFLLMSGYPNDVLQARGVGSQDFLQKPFDAPALRKAVRAVLDASATAS